MSLALSRIQAGKAICPICMRYGAQERRRSRNMAAFGMFGAMSIFAAFCSITHAERTIILPSPAVRRIAMVQAQFQIVPPHEQMQTTKLLTQTSDFLIPQDSEPVEEKHPEPQAAVKPAPKPEEKPEIKPEPAPEKPPAPKPRVKKEVKPKQSPAQKPKLNIPQKGNAQVNHAPSAPNMAESAPPVLGAAASAHTAPAAEAENVRNAKVLAVILQAVERYKRYPRQGRRSGAEGVCTLMVQVGENGRIDSCLLNSSSGRAVLDAAAKQLGKNLLGLNVGSHGSLKVLIPIHYRLTDS